jgi:hypothetical protein
MPIMGNAKSFATAPTRGVSRQSLSWACLFAILLTAPSTAAADAPAGIFSLGQARNNPTTSVDERLGGIRDYDFVSGFTLRLFWNDLEPAAGQYNFSVIDAAIQRVSALGQSLDVEIFTGNEPAYVLNGASATYTDHRGETNPVPWDPFAQARHAALFTALGSHVVQGDGAPHPLSLDPTLKSIDVAPAGLNYGVRDLNEGIQNHPQYTQQRYMDAVVSGVAAATAAFPHDTNSLAFFSFDDGAPGPHVDDQLIARLAQLYNGPGQPKLAFFVENLSDEWPVPLSNGNGLGNNLEDWADEGGATMMQALDAWLDHTPERADQLASLNPSTGIELAFEQYGTRFFELYLPDLDGAAEGALDAAGEPLIDGLRFWNDLLTAPEAPGSDADFNGDGNVNSADLALWKTGFGRPASPTNLGDADGDQDVDGADFLRWQRQLGAATIASTAIPEPPSLALGVIIVFAIGLVGRRQLTNRGCISGVKMP